MAAQAIVTLSQLRRLRQYPTSSWAIWNTACEDSLQFFEDNVGKLRSDVVFVGLNRSLDRREWTNNFQNFHKVGHQGDAALKRNIQGQQLTRLIGGYMTDLSEVFEARSGEVAIDILAAGNRLEEQLSILQASRPNIVCFGERVFKCLCKFYGVTRAKRDGIECASVNGARPRFLFRVYHYSMNGYNNKNVVERLPNQLTTLNALI